MLKTGAPSPLVTMVGVSKVAPSKSIEFIDGAESTFAAISLKSGGC